MKLRIEKAIYGGDGLARVPAGKTVFVPGTLPGELVEATIATDRRSFATSELNAVLEPSPERVVPGCEYVPRCGGCQYQHASPAFQLQMKLDILRETMARAHVAVPVEIASLAGSPWGYRNRIRLHLMRGALGYRQRGSHQLLPVTHCPIAAPLIEQAIVAVACIAAETRLESLCEEVEFFTNGEQDQLLVSLLPGPRQRFRDQALGGFAERLQLEIPALTGVGLLSQNTMAHWGRRSVTYTVSGIPYQVSLGGFFQVNRFLLPELLQLAVTGRAGRLAWDLYSGAGLFARALDFENVTAVESEGFSTDDLKKNLEKRLHRVVRSSTLDFLRSQAAAQEKPELVVVDPPRAGLGKEICSHLARVAAPEIIYVSCDPATLARDLQALLQSGYSIETMNLVDLFPQTFHLETVTFLKRN
ncbi:MAG: TRAM domain-containing protein [Acidobacteriaceae bacterium]|jgi:23S rRNA (uracil1939-C5)-methyltransferase